MGFLLQDLNRQTLRAPTNPMDRATIVSISPLMVDEIKPTLQPSRFIVLPGSYAKPSTSVIEPSSWWRELDPEQPLLEIPVSAVVIAESVIRDYCIGLLACDMDGAMPGFFSVPGAQGVEEIKAKHQKLIDKADQKQKNWYAGLVRLADALWTRTNGNPMSISETMRLAARELQLEKPWMKDFAVMQLKNCPACGALRNNDFPVCSTCRTIIDPAAYEKAGFKQAQ